MPQLDRYLVFSEIFWFIIFFLISYFFIYYLLTKFFYNIKTRSLIFLISQLSSDLLRSERRQNQFLIPRYVEGNFLNVILVDSLVAIEKSTMIIYRLFLLNNLLRDIGSDVFGVNLFNRFLLANILPKVSV